MKMTDQLRESMATLIDDLKHPLKGVNAEFLITERELGAIKNLIRLAEERVWLAESFPKKPVYDTKFDELINPEMLEHARESIKVVDDLHRNNKDRLRESK